MKRQEKQKRCIIVNKDLMMMMMMVKKITKREGIREEELIITMSVWDYEEVRTEAKREAKSKGCVNGINYIIAVKKPANP